MRFLVFCAALAGCGGIIDTGDGGAGGIDGGDVVTKEASAVDVIVTPSCSPIQTATSIDANGGCQSSASWSCGDTKYSVQCDCPSTKCTCDAETSQGGTSHVVTGPSFCPKCDPSVLPSQCGFPTN